MSKLFFILPIILLIYNVVIDEEILGNYFYIIIFISALYLADINKTIYKEWSYIFLAIAVMYNPFKPFVEDNLFYLDIILIIIYLRNYIMHNKKTKVDEVKYTKDDDLIKDNFEIKETVEIKSDIDFKSDDNNFKHTKTLNIPPIDYEICFNPELKEKEEILFDTSNPYSIIGIGGGGTNIIKELNQINLNTYNLLAINSDKKALDNSNIKDYRIYLDKSDGYGCGGNEKEGFKLIDKTVEKKLDAFCKEKETIYIVATLGGGIGTGSTEAIINHLLSINKEIVSFLILPFDWEGKKKKQKVMNMLDRLPLYNHSLKICLFHNQDLHTSYQDKSMKECFSMINKTINKMIINKKYQMNSNIINIVQKNEISIYGEVLDIQDIK